MPIFIKDDKQLLFIHIPKCGGTFIENAFLGVLSEIHLYCPRNGDLPCTPQHFHKPLLNIVYNDRQVRSFAVIRHPVLRIVSEYFWERKFFDSDARLLDIEERILGWFDHYSFDSYTRDNHIRPQCEFILEGTKIFRLEDGYEAALRYAEHELGVTASRPSDGDENKSRTENLVLSKFLVDRINEFYECDFYLLGYRMPEVGSDGIHVDELKALLASEPRHESIRDRGRFDAVINENRLKHEFRKGQLQKIVGRDGGIYRDEAIRMEGASVGASYLLMRRAKELKPGDEFIESKVEHYEKLLDCRDGVNLPAARAYFGRCPDERMPVEALDRQIEVARQTLAEMTAKAAGQPGDGNRIPRTIWMYWDSGLKAAPEVVRLSVESWRRLNPDHEVRLLDDSTIAGLVDIGQLFKIASVRLGVPGKSDVLRSFLLAAHGGIWADSTTFCLKPLREWLDRETENSGFFAFRQEEKVRDRQLVSWFMASSKANPIAANLFDRCRDYVFKPRAGTLTLNKNTVFEYPGVLREGTGLITLNAMEKEGFFPYFFFHYLFNEAVVEGQAKEIWRAVKASSNRYAQPDQDLRDALVSKQMHRENYTTTDTYLQRKRFLESVQKKAAQ